MNIPFTGGDNWVLINPKLIGTVRIQTVIVRIINNQKSLLLFFSEIA